MSEAIGKITGTHGVKGEVVLEHELTGTLDAENWDALMIELLPNSRIPFFIFSIKKQSSSSLLVRFEEINSPEEATEILQKDVYLSPNIQTSFIEKKVTVDDYIGYTLFDKEKRIGLIDNILNPKTNPLFIIGDGTENELLIPANKELFLNIDPVKKTISIRIPNGLLD